jgi:Flp pilus assembly CpaE family ATPase
MRAGVREIVKPPFTREQMEDLMARMAALVLRRNSPPVVPNLCAFLPSRAGTGTTTLACHLSRTMAAESSNRVLLADFDLVSSTLRYVLNFNQGTTIRDAADSMEVMDEWRWQQIVVRMGGLDVLNAGSLNPRRSLRTDRVRQLLEFAASQYQVICADLSGNMEAYSLEVLRSAGAIFIVTQPDPLSLGAARDKVEFLQTLGLAPRAGLLLRQTPHSTLPAASQVEKFCGLPVSGVFDYTDFRLEHVSEEGDQKPLPSALRRQLVRMAKGVTDTIQQPVFQRPVQSSGFAISWR